MPVLASLADSALAHHVWAKISPALIRTVFHMRLFSLLTGLGILAFSGFLQSASAGERLEYNVVQANAQEQRVTIYVQGAQVRILNSADQAAAVIYNADYRKIHILNHGDKSITTLDQSSLEQLASITQGMGNIAQSQGSVLGDIFKTLGLESALGETATIEVKTLRGEKKYSGQSCQVQQVFRDGALSTQICLAKQLRMQAPEKKTLDSLINFAQLMLRQGQMVIAQFNLPVPLLPDGDLAGTPVYIEDLTSNTTATLVGFKQMDILAAQFALPEGYSRRVLSL